MLKPPYTAAAVANFFIEKNVAESRDLSHLKIQKLLYYAQGWHMANYGLLLFNEPIEAWRHGPVVRSIYNALSGSGDRQIFNKISVVYDQGYGQPDIPEEDVQTRDFLEEFWKVYGPLHAFALTNATHDPGTPWDTVVKLNRGCLGYGEIIPNSLIHEHFKAQKVASEVSG